MQSQRNQRPALPLTFSTKVHFNVTARSRLNNLFTFICGVFYILSMTKSTAHANGLFLCDRDQPSQCRYGGKCTLVSSLPSLNEGEFNADQHFCKCESFECASMGYDPVCGSDGQTYVNDVCRRAQECAIQEPIERVCKGICGEETCTSVTETVQRCPVEDSGLCDNFGECLFSVETNESYCKCLEGYSGPRCEERLIPGPRNIVGNTTNTDDSGYKVAFYCVVSVLVLVLVLHITYCIIRYRGSSKNFWDYDEERKIGPGSHPIEVKSRPVQHGELNQGAITADETQQKKSEG